MQLIAAQIESDQARDRVRSNPASSYTIITAPSDGRMGVRLIDPGNLVHAAEATLDCHLDA